MMKTPSESCKTNPRAGARADWKLQLYVANMPDHERILVGLDLRPHAADLLSAGNGK